MKKILAISLVLVIVFSAIQFAFAENTTGKSIVKSMENVSNEQINEWINLLSDEDAPITDIYIESYRSSPGSTTPAGYEKIDKDLNKGAGGNYIYLYYSKRTDLEPITSLYVAVGDSSNVTVPEGYTKIDSDLNKGAGGKYIYLCYTRNPYFGSIKGLEVTFGDDIVSGYTKIDVDLNKGCGGEYIYLWYKK
jgi:hypothetical protein